jgi:hypothetical protein
MFPYLYVSMSPCPRPCLHVLVYVSISSSLVSMSLAMF